MNATSGVSPATTQVTPDPRLHKAAQEFEAMLLSELLKMGSEEGSSGDGLGQSSLAGYEDLRDQAVATALARDGGIGIGRMLERYLAPHPDIKAFSFSADT